MTIQKTETGKRLTGGSHGRAYDITVDEILVGAGRTPNVNGLGLEAAGVGPDKTGVTVDDHLRTTNPNIYAAGDICSRYKFTHAADAMAQIVIQNALFPHPFGLGTAQVSSLVIPWATYTDPEIAHVGLYEAEAKEKGHRVETFTHRLDEVDRAVLDGEAEGFARVHVEAGKDAPRLMESAEQCLSRHSIAVWITAVLPDGERRFTGMGMDIECDLRQLPTATAVPATATTAPPAPVSAPPSAPAPAGPNLLTNPGFELDGTAWEIVKSAATADFNVYTAGDNPQFVHSGKKALTEVVTTRAILSQRVENNVTPGTTYRAGVWVKVWSSSGEKRTVSENPGEVGAQICLNVAGEGCAS